MTNKSRFRTSKRIFNQYITQSACMRGCVNQFVVDENKNIVKDKDKDKRCSCYFEEQYLIANIGYSYWDLTLKNYQGHPADSAALKAQIKRIPESIQDGQGFYIHGGNGSGKSTMSMIYLKTILHTTPYSAMFVPFADLVIMNSRIVGGYNDRETIENIDIIKNIDFLVLDDIGKEYDSSKDYTRATLNSILRYRDLWNKPTIYTANSPIEQLKDHYGASNFSIMQGRSEIITMENDMDFRVERKLN